MRLIRFALLSCVLLSAACNFPQVPAGGAAFSAATATPFMPLAGDPVPAEATVPAAATNTWWFSPDLPSGYVEALSLPEESTILDDKDATQLRISIDDGQTISMWVYALVAPFPTLTDEVTFDDVQAAWDGADGRPFDGAPLMMSAETEAVFSAWWGEPDAGAVQVEDSNQLLEAAWASQPSWAIVPFEELQPKWKVLAVDGRSPIWKEFDPEVYLLSVPIGLSGDPALVTAALEAETLMAPVSNRNPDKLTTVILTGVTALVRATAYEMNRRGVTYPAEDIGPMLREADITHISNEVPFARDCPPPDPVQRNLIFCSDASYIDLLEAVGVDVVELTGDHFNDWSRDAMLYTLELYDERGWPYYGGGANIAEAMQPLFFEHNGNKIAFIGCNGKGGSYASAREDYPGTWACDYEYMEAKIRELVEQGYLVIATFQHNEVYQFIPAETLVRDFGRVSTAGATIVSGSQAHQSHGIEFPRDDAIITYGLGNLFFDQRGVVDNSDRALIARHVFYEGRYISTELITIQFVDFAKPRFMTPDERTNFLTLIFNASIWDEGE
ncbi:MAG: CapA family protein [Anaerolineales bacterium]